jgi:hypothetical protein
MPNQVSIRLSQLDPTGVMWKVTFGVAGQPGPHLGSVVRGQAVQHYVDLLTGVRLDRLAQEGQERVRGYFGPYPHAERQKRAVLPPLAAGRLDAYLQPCRRKCRASSAARALI